MKKKDREIKGNKGCYHSARLQILEIIYFDNKTNKTNLLTKTSLDKHGFDYHLDFLIKTMKIIDRGKESKERFRITQQGLYYMNLLNLLKNQEQIEEGELK